MGYIIVARFDTESDEVSGYWREKLLNDNIGILSDNGREIAVDMKGDHSEIQERTKYMVNALVDSGIYDFSIHHSY